MKKKKVALEGDFVTFEYNCSSENAGIAKDEIISGLIF